MKTYSSRSNARRAALTAGIPASAIATSEVADGFVFTDMRATQAAPAITADTFEATTEELAAQASRASVVEAKQKSQDAAVEAKLSVAEQIKKWRTEGVTEDFRPVGHRMSALGAVLPEAKAGKATKTTLRPDGLREGSAMAKLVDAVLEDGGKTNAELCELVGWGQCLPMLRKSCEKAGLVLTTVKEKGQPARYIATRAA